MKHSRLSSFLITSGWILLILAVFYSLYTSARFYFAYTYLPETIQRYVSKEFTQNTADALVLGFYKWTITLCCVGLSTIAAFLGAVFLFIGQRMKYKKLVPDSTIQSIDTANLALRPNN